MPLLDPSASETCTPPRFRLQRDRAGSNGYLLLLLAKILLGAAQLPSGDSPVSGRWFTAIETDSSCPQLRPQGP